MDLNSVDWGASGRTDTYSLTLVEPFGLSEVGSAEFVPSSSSITWAADTDAVQSASIALVGDFRQHERERMLRVKHAVRVGGVEVDEVLGTFFVDGVSRESASGRLSRRLSCYSSLWRLSQDVLADDYFEASGANALAACVRLITYAGGLAATDHEVDPAAVLISDEFHQIGENRLETLRTVAGNRDWRIGVDPYGLVTVYPYTEPSARPVRYRFRGGSQGIALVGLAMTPTRSEAVNRVVAWWSREELPDDGTAGWGYSKRYVADLDEGQPFSYERTGRRKTMTLRLSEPCSAAALKARAEACLRENAGDQTDLTIRHPQVPGLRLGDVVTYTNDHDEPEPLSLTCEVTQMSASLTPGMVCQTRMRVIDWSAR